MADPQDNTLRIVLVGKTGNGKSATGNTILGRKEFESRIGPHAINKGCKKASREWKGRNLLIVDTKGLFDTKETLETTCKKISQCVFYSCPGPHAIVMVLQLGRYTNEDQKTVDLIKAVFGKAAMKHMIVLFTRKDNLEGQSLDDYIAEADVNLRSVIRECGNRCCAFNNRGTEAEKEAQVQELVGLIEQMVWRNGGAYFSDDIYKDTEERLKRKAEVLKKIYTDELHKNIMLVEKEYAHKLQQEVEEKTEALKVQYDEKIKNLREEAERGIFAEVFNGIRRFLSRIWHMFW